MAIHKLAGLKWSEQYNCYRTTVAGWLELTFSYREGAYVVSVAGRTCKDRGDCPDKAASIAVRVAESMLSGALKELTSVH